MSVYGAGTIAALRALPGPFVSESDVAIVDGYHTAGDGGGGTFHWNATATEPDDNGLTFKPASLSGAGRWKRLFDEGSLNVRWFGAHGDNSHDDTDVVQKLIESTQTSIPVGGVIYFPPGQYKIEKQLVLKSRHNIRLLGAGAQTSPHFEIHSWPTSSLHFYTDGNGLPKNGQHYPALIDARSCSSFEMDGLGIIQENAAFTGIFVDLSHDDKTGSDAMWAHFTRCSFASAVFDKALDHYPITARCAISFSTAIECTVEKCTFERVLSGVRGIEEIADGNSSFYSNVVTIRDSQFRTTPTGIMNPGQTWLVEGCTFEGLQGKAVDYMHHAVNVDLRSTQYLGGLFTFRDNWCGDSFGDQIWIRLRDSYNTIIESNLFAGCICSIQFFGVAGSSPGCGGVSIRNNSFGDSSYSSSLSIDFGAYIIGAHTGTGLGILTLSGSPKGRHHIVIRIDTSGPPVAGTGVSWSYAVDGGTFVSVGHVMRLEDLGGLGINVFLDGDHVGDSFIAGDTYAFDTPSDIVWNGCTVEGNDLSGLNLTHLPPKYSINFIGNRVARPRSVPAEPTVNGVWIQPALPPDAVPREGGGLLAWYKADSLALNENDPVAIWPDSSGNGWNLTQDAVSKRPTFHRNTQNTLPVVRFDGVDDCLVSGDMHMGTPGTVIVVFTANGSPVSADTVIDGNTSGANTMRMYRSGHYQMNLGGLQVGVFPARCAVYAMVATGRADGSSSVRAGDFVVQGNLTNVIEYVHSIVVGADGAGVNPIAMDLAEIALFERYLYPDEVVGIMNSLRAKWQCI